MKAIVISDHAKWCALMMNGDKTVEVRKGTALYKATKKLIDEYGFAEFYVYCTKGKDLLVCGDSPFEDERKLYTVSKENIALNGNELSILNGKVIFKFRCYKVEKLSIKYGVGWQTKTIKGKEQVEKLTQLSVFQLFEYCGRKTSTAIHISDLEIFDRPKELSEFNKKGYLDFIKPCEHPRYPETYKYFYKSVLKVAKHKFRLTKAPQSWCYVEV